MCLVIVLYTSDRMATFGLVDADFDSLFSSRVLYLTQTRLHNFLPLVTNFPYRTVRTPFLNGQISV